MSPELVMYCEGHSIVEMAKTFGVSAKELRRKLKAERNNIGMPARKRTYVLKAAYIPRKFDNLEVYTLNALYRDWPEAPDKFIVTISGKPTFKVVRID